MSGNHLKAHVAAQASQGRCRGEGLILVLGAESLCEAESGVKNVAPVQSTSAPFSTLQLELSRKQNKPN